MLTALASWPFVCWLAIGSAIAWVLGFFAMSQGRFFRAIGGQLVVALLAVILLGTVGWIGYQVSILAALISVIVFWSSIGFGGRTMARSIQRKYR
jgi:hypothetical protein